MRKILLFGALFALILGTAACARNEAYETSVSETELPYPVEAEQPDPLPTPDNYAEESDITAEDQQQDVHEPDQQISPFGRQAAIEFLSEFTSIFQSSIGLHDSNTGGFYALSEDQEWVDIDSLPPSDVPLIFQGGVRSGVPDFWYTDTWGVFFNSNFYDSDGNLITNVPFIREPEFADRDYGVIAVNFTLFDFNGDGIPEIIIGFHERGVSVWDTGEEQMGGGHMFTRPFILYSFVDGVYQEIAQMPTVASSAAGYLATFAPIFLNHHGEVVIYASDGHREPAAYYIRMEDNSVELERVNFEFYDLDDWIAENFTYIEEFLPLTDLQNEITELMSLR